MDNLPHLCLENILSFLPIADVFRVMSVSRKWQAAAIEECKHRDTIVIDSPAYEEDRPIISPLDTITVTSESVAFAVWKSINRMKLKILAIYVPMDRPYEVFDNLINRNHETLQSLHYSADLPFVPGGLFKLKKLHCRHVQPYRAYQFYDLTDIKVTDQRSPDLMAHMDGNKYTKLSYRKDVLPTYEAEFITTIDNMMHLRNIRVLHLVMWLKKCPDLQPFVKLFQRMRRLEEVELSLSDKKLSLDPVIESLVANNPKIRHISMIGMKVTDASLHSLARLSHLDFLQLAPDRDEFVTTDGIIAFLRGNSRKILKFCCLCWNPLVDMDRIGKEISLIETEIGKTFDRKQDKINCIHYSWS